jgi:hypothetical protein
VAELPSGIDTSKPHPARMYDYFLGGKNHFAADRQAADAVLAVVPSTRTTARENRAFIGRAVRYLVTEAGIRQFLDIGTGLPTENNVHDVAQALEPSARVVYVDYDPLVLAHARALLTSSPAGRTAYIQADLREPATILADAGLRDVLDLGQPVALILAAVLHFLPDDTKPAAVLATLLDALPSGSYLVASHITGEHLPPRTSSEGANTYRAGGVPLQVRDSSEFGALAFTGLELVPPGLVLVSEWRPDRADVPAPAPSEVNIYGAVARKR